MPTSKAERLMDLVIALLNAPYPRTAQWVRGHVAGYDDAASDDAFARMFERDKSELRDLGIPIETDAAGRYRISPGEFALPPMTFTPAESAALAVASRLWETTQLRDAGNAAMRKVRDAAADDEGQDVAAGGGIHVRLRTPDAAFADLLAATREGRAVRFDYRAAGRDASEQRHVHPWGLVNYRGTWYVVGEDTVRRARRTFRLSRITGPVETVGAAGVVRIPPDVVLRDEVVAAADATERTAALLRIRSGRAAGIRRGGTVLSRAAGASAPDRDAAAGDDFDEVQVSMGDVRDLARRIAGHGGDVIVVDPEELRVTVTDLLRGAIRAHTDARVTR